MNTGMNGKRIKQIWWDDGEGGHLKANEGRELVLSATHHGDHNEFWVLQHENGIEIARHNCKYIAGIEWDNPASAGEEQG